MAKGIDGVVLGQLRTLFELGAVGLMSDGELIDRFLDDRDSSGRAAFGVLVERHGPMVFAVCRGLLKASHDREDAFQATFLVLARKARSIRNRDSIAPWLFGVARKISLRARSNADRRRLMESASIDRDFPESAASDSSGPFEELIAEVGRLPDRLREPIILCYWQGMTYDESANVLGVTEGAIRGRLARARDRLRDRLAAKGIDPETTVSGAFLLGTLERVPLRLIESTSRALVATEAGRTISGIVPATVLPLTQGAWSFMFTTKAKVVVALSLTVIGVFGIGSVVVGWPQQRDVLVIKRPVALESASVANPSPPEDAKFENLVDGKVIRSVEVTKDCMILSYLPDWGFGNVDNIGVEGHDGGVRTLVDWPELPAQEAKSNSLRFYLAFYARKVNEKPRPGSIVALEILGDWPELTSWRTRPSAEAETVGIYKFEPGEGWKVFEITPFVRAKTGQSGHGLMFRYINEDRPGTLDWTGYQLVSREGTDQWAKKRPRLLVVDTSRK